MNHSWSLICYFERAQKLTRHVRSLKHFFFKTQASPHAAESRRLKRYLFQFQLSKNALIMIFPTIKANECSSLKLNNAIYDILRYERACNVTKRKETSGCPSPRLQFPCFEWKIVLSSGSILSDTFPSLNDVHFNCSVQKVCSTLQVVLLHRAQMQFRSTKRWFNRKLQRLQWHDEMVNVWMDRDNFCETSSTCKVPFTAV